MSILTQTNYASEKKQKVIVILGPTASGKSDLAVKLAFRLGSEQAKKLYGINGAEIISADSRQVYKGFNIGSGKVPRDNSKVKNQKSKPSPQSGILYAGQLKNRDYFYKGIRHHLLDAASPKKIFTVVQYQKLAKKALADITKRGKIPIICGGTGLYIDAIIYDTKFPEVPPQLKLRKKLEKLSTENLFEKLKKLDQCRAKNIDKNNRRRLIRALEIVLTTKKPVEIIQQAQGKKSSYNFLKIGIAKSPEKLKKLIEKRLTARLRQGMLDEIKNLHNGSGLSPRGEPSASYGISWKRLDNLGLEYRYASRHLRGLISKTEMIEQLNKEICNYAKRQMTWFRRDKNTFWTDSEKGAFKAVEKFLR